MIGGMTYYLVQAADNPAPTETPRPTATPSSTALPTKTATAEATPVQSPSPEATNTVAVTPTRSPATRVSLTIIAGASLQTTPAGNPTAVESGAVETAAPLRSINAPGYLLAGGGILIVLALAVGLYIIWQRVRER